VSVGTGGVQANDGSGGVALSADGRFVAFESWASNLVPGDTNGAWDAFVHDRRTGKTTRVSVTSRGAQSGGSICCISTPPRISADGRFVAFQSEASDLDPFDLNESSDVFVHDLLRHKTRRVSRTAAGGQAIGPSFSPALSADGRLVAFTSEARNLVPGDTNGVSDIFVTRW
jgi:Tol biopolymer transport system component